MAPNLKYWLVTFTLVCSKKSRFLICMCSSYSVASSSDLCCFDLSTPPPPPPKHPIYRFAGRTVTSSSLVLVTVATKDEGAAQLTVNCEKMVIGTMLVKDILLALTQ